MPWLDTPVRQVTARDIPVPGAPVMRVTPHEIPLPDARPFDDFVLPQASAIVQAARRVAAY